MAIRARAAARPAVVLVSREVHTFVGTLAEDLLLARPAASEDDLLTVLDSVGAGSWLATLPDGLATAEAGSTGWWCWMPGGSSSRAPTTSWSQPAAATPRCGPRGRRDRAG